jgi:hypothetical protein
VTPVVETISNLDGLAEKADCKDRKEELDFSDLLFKNGELKIACPDVRSNW